MNFNKLKSVQDLSEIIKSLKLAGKKIVLSHGAFDVIHYGHINYFQEAKKCGDILIVSVVADDYVRKGLSHPVSNQKIRSEGIAMLECVDFVVLCENFGPWEIMKQLRPNIYAKGEDAKQQLDDPNSSLSRDKQIIEGLGGVFTFTKTIPIHSTDILNSYSDILSDENIKFLSSFKQKHNVTDLIRRVEGLEGLKVLVIGETIIDEYRYVMPLGKANKTSIISAQYLENEKFAGGILACANHVAGICRNVDLVSYLGENDPQDEFIKANLKSNITPKFFYCPGQPTIVKARYVEKSYLTKFFEVYVYDKNYLPRQVEDQVYTYLNQVLAGYDLVLVVDYGHGFLSSSLIELISKKSKFLAVNTQTNSGNTGFNYITKYPRANYVVLDELEARLAVQDSFGSVERVLLDIYGKISTSKIVLTMAQKGCLGYDSQDGYCKIPTFATRAIDPIGAGDAFLAISAPCAAVGFSTELVTFFGSIASSIAVNIICNKNSVEREELFKKIGYWLD